MDHRDRRFVIQDRPKSPRENWDWQERQIALYQISLEFELPFLDQNELIERSRIDIALKRAYAIQPIRLIGPAIPSQLDSDLVTFPLFEGGPRGTGLAPSP